MATVRQHEIYLIREIRPVGDWSFDRGNSRRFRSLGDARRAQIPEHVNIRATVATHEVELVGKIPKARVKQFSPNPEIKHALVLLMGVTAGLPRPNFCKTMLYMGQWYYIMTWTDLFGASIKESQMEKTRQGNAILFLIKAEDEQALVLEQALKDGRISIRL